jgi:hypothetical protein
MSTNSRARPAPVRGPQDPRTAAAFAFTFTFLLLGLLTAGVWFATWVGERGCTDTGFLACTGGFFVGLLVAAPVGYIGTALIVHQLGGRLWALAPLAPILGTVAAFQIPLGLSWLALYLVPGLLTAAWVYWYRRPAAPTVPPA